jgi:hypothetical protein
MSLQIMIGTGPHSYDCGWDDVKVEANVTPFPSRLRLSPRFTSGECVAECEGTLSSGSGWYTRVKYKIEALMKSFRERSSSRK